MENLRIAIGSDHGGYEYKEQIVSHLKEKGYECVDVGTYSTDSCDYPVIARAVTTKITTGEADRGILICGTGIGMSIVATLIVVAVCIPVIEIINRKNSWAIGKF